jgi:hypothetical protein
MRKFFLLLSAASVLLVGFAVGVTARYESTQPFVAPVPEVAVTEGAADRLAGSLRVRTISSEDPVELFDRIGSRERCSRCDRRPLSGRSNRSAIVCSRLGLVEVALSHNGRRTRAGAMSITPEASTGHVNELMILLSLMAATPLQSAPVVGDSALHSRRLLVSAASVPPETQ